VFANLRINASQTIPANGVIAKRTCCAKDWGRVEIGDNGAGLRLYELIRPRSQALAA
jgi:hypothetical protein